MIQIFCICLDSSKFSCFIRFISHLAYFFVRNCTGPNVTTLVGSDFCDRSDVQKMLNETNSDLVKCIYNPGNSKIIRFSSVCHSSVPSDHMNLLEQGLIGTEPISPNLLMTANFFPSPDFLNPMSGAVWTIQPGEHFRVPVLKDTSTGDIIHSFRVNSVLFCRVMKITGMVNSCVDNPLRSATRIAKILVDGIEV
jgi:hypothetical protein